jgi:hypothetical protein
MSRELFHVRVEDFEEVHELPGSWPPEALRKVLAAAEFEDEVAPEDLDDMALMALQDLELHEAAELVLGCVFGESVRPGVRQNLAGELDEDSPWEQFSDVSMQAGIFEAVVLLHRAFPKFYGTPDAVRIRARIAASDVETSKWLRTPHPSLLVRILSGGMPDSAVLARLYEDELKGTRFAAAADILWRVDMLEESFDQTPGELELDVYSSRQWLSPLQHVESWTVRAWPDEA